jgi:hypothetical protein
MAIRYRCGGGHAEAGGYHSTSGGIRASRADRAWDAESNCQAAAWSRAKRAMSGSRPSRIALANGTRGGSSGRPVVVRWRSRRRAGTRNAWRQAREVAACRGRSGQLGAQLYRNRRVAALYDAHFGARRGRRFVGHSCPLLSGYFGRVAMRSNARRSATDRPRRGWYLVPAKRRPLHHDKASALQMPEDAARAG